MDRTCVLSYINSIANISWCHTLSALKVKSKILKCIIYLTGSQCNSSKTGVIWSYLRLEVSNLAAAFCTLCSLVISQSGRP